MGKLVIVRHGESTWNAKGVLTGTTDVHLTDKGRHESELMGQALHDIRFDQVYVSEQTRTSETLHGILKYSPTPDVPVKITGAINERDYGKFTGKNKWEVKEAIGEEAFQQLRRSWDYPVEDGETIKDVYERSVPFYKEQVVPLLQQDKTVLIVAHGNSIRSLIKYIENISDQEISNVEMIFGTAVIYKTDENGHMVSKTTRTIDSPLPPA